MTLPRLGNIWATFLPNKKPEILTIPVFYWYLGRELNSYTLAGEGF